MRTFYLLCILIVLPTVHALYYDSDSLIHLSIPNGSNVPFSFIDDHIIIYADEHLTIYNMYLEPMLSTPVGMIDGTFAVTYYDDDTYPDIVGVFDGEYTVFEWDKGLYRIQNISVDGGGDMVCTDGGCLFKDQYGVLYYATINGITELINLSNGKLSQKGGVQDIRDYDRDGDLDILVNHDLILATVDFQGNNQTVDLAPHYEEHVQWIYTSVRVYQYFYDQEIHAKFIDQGKEKMDIVWVAGSGAQRSIGLPYVTYQSKILFLYHNLTMERQHVCGWTSPYDYAGKVFTHACRYTDPYIGDIDGDGDEEMIVLHEHTADHINIHFYNNSMSSNSIILGCTYDAYTDYRGCMDYSGAHYMDVDEDGYVDYVTPYGVINHSGTIIDDYETVSRSAPVPIDFDGNSGIDLVYSTEGLTTVALNNHTYTDDIVVSNMTFLSYPDGNVYVHVDAKNHGRKRFDVMLLDKKNGVNHTFRSSQEIGSNFTLEDGDTVIAVGDYHDEIDETSEHNNFVEEIYMNLPTLSFLSYTGNLHVADVIEMYLADSLTYARYKEGGELTLLFGVEEELCSFGYNGTVYADNTVYELPYNGIVGKQNDTIYIMGNDITGELAALKWFMDNENTIINGADCVYHVVNASSTYGLDAYDYLHLSGNVEHLGDDSEMFAEIVHNYLYGTMFEVSDHNTSALGVDLRLRNLKPKKSDAYENYLNENHFPVVLARGLWSNLTAWEEFGAELANDGRDVWLIEITGGPGTETFNYNFDDLTDSFVPALLEKVLDSTGKERLQYVGFSNGCRSALVSLEKGMFDPSKVETFVAVGCPGNFSGFHGASLLNDKKINQSILWLENSGKNHFSMGDVKKALLLKEINPTNEQSTISLNLLKNYTEWIQHTNEHSPGLGLKLDNFFILQGNAFISSDGIVTTKDENMIYAGIELNTPEKNNTNIKRYFSNYAAHFSVGIMPSLADKKSAKKLIKKSLFKQDLNIIENNYPILLKQSTKRG